MPYYSSLLFGFSLLSVGTKALDESCVKNTDCNIKGAICITGKCNCDDLSYYNNTQCLPYATEYNAFCYETPQCEWLGDNAECKNNRCACQKTFRWYKGKCQAYVDKGEKCQSDDDCYNGYDLLSLTCSSGVCTCSEGYYDRGHDCRKSSTVLNDCAIDFDCKDSSVCTLGKCSVDNATSVTTILHYDLNDGEIEERKSRISPNIEGPISCETDGDCGDIANSLCDLTMGTCGCNEETHYFYNGNCIPGLGPCSSPDNCTDSNTMCFKNTCICKQGFFLKGNDCIAELGMYDPNTDDEENQCPIKPSQLVNSTCYCKDYWFNDEENRNCIKTMVQYTKNCLTNEWCNVMGPYSFCNSTTAQCECVHTAVLNESTFYCEQTEPFPADACLRDNDCNINERCLDEKCECTEYFSRSADSNICLPDVGASCENMGCSHIEHSSCAAGLCNCDSTYTGKVNKCLKIAENLLDNCEAQEQCQLIEHSVCGTPDDEDYDDGNDKCVCEDDYTAVNTKCYQDKKFGDPCVTESDCTLVLNHSYKCRNSICQCDVGKTLKNGYCTSSGSAIFGSHLLLLIILLKLGIS